MNNNQSSFSLKIFEEQLKQDMKKTSAQIQKTLNNAQEEDLELSRATTLTVFKEVFDNYYRNNYDINCLPYMIDFQKDKKLLANTQFSIDSSKFRFSKDKKEREFNKNESPFSPLQIFRKRSVEYKSTFFIEGESINKDFTDDQDNSQDKVDKMNSIESDQKNEMTDYSSDSVRQENFNKVNIDASNLTRMNNPDFIGGDSIDKVVKVANERAKKEMEKIHKNVRKKYLG